MSLARPLSGFEVVSAVTSAIRALESEMQLEGADLATEVNDYLLCFSSLAAEHLTYPHVGWDLEGTIQKEKGAGVGAAGPRPRVWASITLDLDLGGGALISRRFGTWAPDGTDTAIRTFPAQQKPIRTPDVLRERWINRQQAEHEPELPASASDPKEPEAPAPPPVGGAAWVHVPDEDEPLASPVGELPSLPSVESDEEAEAEPPVPAKKRGRPTKR